MCFVVDSCALDVVEILEPYERIGVVYAEKDCMVRLHYDTCCVYLAGYNWMVVVAARAVDSQVLCSGHLKRYVVQGSQYWAASPLEG